MEIFRMAAKNLESQPLIASPRAHWTAWRSFLTVFILSIVLVVVSAFQWWSYWRGIPGIRRGSSIEYATDRCHYEDLVPRPQWNGSTFGAKLWQKNRACVAKMAGAGSNGVLIWSGRSDQLAGNEGIDYLQDTSFMCVPSHCMHCNAPSHSLVGI
jgi:hypothetical protein